MRLPGSIRARITLAACAVVTPVLVAGALMFVHGVRKSLVSQKDGAALAWTGELVRLVGEGQIPRLLQSPNEDVIGQVLDSNGAIIAASDIALLDRPLTQTPADRRFHRSPVVIDVIDPDERVRLRGEFIQTDHGRLTVYVGYDVSQVDEPVDAAGTSLAIAVPILLTVFALVCSRAVGRALRPVEAMREQVAEISAVDRARRVPEPKTADEIGRLARTMNGMLDRLSAADSAQRQFVADASHELKSPLAASRAELDLALAAPESTDWLGAAALLSDDNHRMSRLVNDLLFLARVDEAGVQPRRGPVDLDDVIHEVCDRTRLRGGVSVDTSAVEPVEIRGDAHQLDQLIGNVLDNAVRHATARVIVSLRRLSGAAVVEVVDDGSGILPSDRERVFERFRRLDDARSRSTGGSGLGLSIAREIARGHRGTITVEDSAIGARFVIRLPITTPPERPGPDALNRESSSSSTVTATATSA